MARSGSRARPREDGDSGDARPREDGDPHALHADRSRVLVVDDEPAIRELAARILTRAGYDVAQASSGFAALRLLAADADFDLVVTDLAMPGKGGLEVAVGARVARPGIAVLFMSGYVSNDVLEALDAPVIAKPFTSDALVRAVRHALAVRDQRSADAGVDGPTFRPTTFRPRD